MFINTGQDQSTVEYLKKSMPEGYRETTIKIKGDERYVDKIEQMLGYMERLGRIGHSTSFKVFIDGDGAFSITTDVDGKQLSKKHLDTITNPEGKDIESFNFD